MLAKTGREPVITCVYLVERATCPAWWTEARQPPEAQVSCPLSAGILPALPRNPCPFSAGLRTMSATERDKPAEAAGSGALAPIPSPSHRLSTRSTASTRAAGSSTQLRAKLSYSPTLSRP